MKFKNFIPLFVVLINFSAFSQENSWKALGPFFGKSNTQEYMHSMGLVNAVLTNPKDENEIIMSTNSSGIWKTKDNGTTWKCVTDKEAFLPGMGIKTFSVNPFNPNAIMAGGGNYCYGDDNYGGVLLLSKDRGETWTKSISFAKVFEGKLVTKVVYLNNKELFVLTNESLFKSIDSGASWEKLFEVNVSQNYIDNKDQALIDFEWFENGAIFISSTHSWGAKGNLFKSKDGGATWENLLKTKEFDNLYENHILFVTMTKPVNGSMYVGVGSGGDVQLFKTKNKGESFYKSGIISTRNPSIDAKAGKFEMEISVSNPNQLYIGSIDLFVWDSINNLKKLSPGGNISKDEHDDIRFLEVLEREGKEVLAMGNDGGVTLYDSESNRFESLNGFNLPTLQVYNLAISQFDSNFMMYIGTQDNGTYEYKNKDWNFVTGGDGGGNAMDDRGYLRMNSINSTLVTYNGKLRRYFTPTHQFSSWFIDFPVEISKSDSVILFGSKKRGDVEGARLFIQNLNEKNNGGIEVKGMNNIGEIAISNSDPALIFIAEGDFCDGNNRCNKLMKTTDKGKSFVSLSNAQVYPHPDDLITRGRDTTTLRQLLGYRKVTDIEIDPYDNEVIYVSLNGNFKPQTWTKNWEYYRVLKSENGGESWTNHSYGLPITPIYALLRDERNDFGLFCGGDEGMFYCDNSNGFWKLMETGFPKNVTATDIKLNYCQSKLYVSTYGRGVFGVKLEVEKGSQEINKNETWSSYRFVKRDIEVKRGNTLTITTDIAMAPGTSIVLHPKSELMIDGAKVSSNCLESWDGIEIKESKFLFFFKRKKGKVIYKNGGEIVNAKTVL